MKFKVACYLCRSGKSRHRVRTNVATCMTTVELSVLPVTIGNYESFTVEPLMTGSVRKDQSDGIVDRSAHREGPSACVQMLGRDRRQFPLVHDPIGSMRATGELEMPCKVRRTGVKINEDQLRHQRPRDAPAWRVSREAEVHITCGCVLLPTIADGLPLPARNMLKRRPL